MFGSGGVDIDDDGSGTACFFLEWCVRGLCAQLGGSRYRERSKDDDDDDDDDDVDNHDNDDDL